MIIIIMMIGIAIVFTAVGLFVGKKLNKEFFEKLKQEKERKLQEKEYIRRLELQAREEALKNLYPKIVEKMEAQELKKLTGEDKKEKLEKFANMFNMGGTNSQDKMSQMLGTSGFNTSTEKILGTTNSTDKTNKINEILGNKTDNTKQETPEEKIKRIIG